MEQTVGVYISHKHALKAVEILIEHGFHKENISIIGQAELIDDNLQINSGELIQGAEVSIGAAAGATLGILTGIGVFAIPGLGFIFGAGALLGAIAGFDFGIIAGGVVAFFTSLGIKKEHVIRMNEQLKEGNFLVIVQGPHKEVHEAREILQGHGTHIELHTH
jgi:hypothetical protein